RAAWRSSLFNRPSPSLSNCLTSLRCCPIGPPNPNGGGPPGPKGGGPPGGRLPSRGGCVPLWSGSSVEAAGNGASSRRPRRIGGSAAQVRLSIALPHGLTIIPTRVACTLVRAERWGASERRVESACALELFAD